MKASETFYKSVSSQYLNIPKTLPGAFLQRQGDYRVKFPKEQTIDAPIVTFIPNGRWGIDLIDMQQYVSVPNLNRRYIMTIVDYLSFKVWARALTNRRNNAAQPILANAINDICVNGGIKIHHIIQVENEFSAGTF